MEYRYRWNEEFQEQDIWGVFSERGEDSESSRRISDNKHTKIENRPKPKKNVQESRVIQPSSAPVNIPDWSKIYGTSPKKWCGWSDDDRSEVVGFARSSWDSDGEDDDDGNVVPPHQLVARRQLSSFSVFEGAGRTLKGRDLSRVRNAVLIKTGFLESKYHD